MAVCSKSEICAPGFNVRFFFRVNELTHSGILHHIERMDSPLSDLRAVCSAVDDKILVIDDLISTFVLIVLGFGVSTLALTFEVLFPKCKLKKMKKSGTGVASNRVADLASSTSTRQRQQISINGKVSTVSAMVQHK